MAPPAGTLRVGRYFLALLAVFAVLYLLVFWPGQRHTPKLGLDLEGGAQVVFQARTPNNATPSSSSMTEARDILEQRVNGTGVANAEVVIQGSDQIVVSVPGKSTSDIKDLGAAAKLNFRPVVMPPAAVGAAAANPSATPTASPGASGGATSGAAAATPSASAPPAAAPSSAAHSGQAEGVRPLATGSPTAAASSASAAPASPAAASPTPAAASPTSAAPKTADPLKGLGFAVPKSEADFDKLTQAQQQQLSAALVNFDCASKPSDVDSATLLACDSTTKPSLVYLLGPVIVPGTEIDTASAVAPNAQNGVLDWTVSLSLKSSGQDAWAKYTGAHNTGGQDSSTPITECGASTTPCANFVAFTLDNEVISAPYNKSAINGQATQISGNFTQTSAETLARQLKYGALPLNFEPLTSQNVSASLGSSQLKAGLLAGGIGLVLVVIYSLIYYRALGLVTVASLLVSGGLTYACLVVLGNQIGFTLTLAGIAGFIVAVGITADSFVVFFERIKDEVHDGRSMRVAVPRAWVRARRTILSADFVSFLAAAVLYYFAAGDVRGFAFTLGLSTVLDLVVVFLFTHPMVSLLSRSAAFGSSRFTGLNALRANVPVAAEPPLDAPSRRRAGRPSGRRGGATAVAVLERPEAEIVDVASGDVAAQPEPITDELMPEPDGRQLVADTEPVADAEPLGDAAPVRDAEPSDRPAAPVGTAAERAAARRARLRAQASDRGEH